MVYADFESFTKPIDSCRPNPDRSFTKAYQKHEPSGFCFYIVCDGKKSRPVLHTKQTEGENMAEIFVEMLRDEVDQVWSTEVKEMILSEKENSNFEKAAECWICKNHRCRSKRIFGGAKDFCSTFPKLAQKVVMHTLPTVFWCGLQKMVFTCFSANGGRHI